MTCEHCQPQERRTPWRVRLSYFSTTEHPLWTVFRLDPHQHGAGHNGYFAVISKPTWKEACDYLRSVS